MRVDWHRDRFIKRDGAHEVECSVCKTKFYLPQSKVGKYLRCSAECNTKHKSEKIQARARPCKTCGKEFIPRGLQLALGRGEFCSHKCHGVANGKEQNPMFGKSITEDQKKKWRETRDKNDSWNVGENNSRWNGGKQATYERLRDSGKTRVYCQNRRLSIKRVGGKLSPNLAKKLFKLQRGKCACCGKPLGANYHLDHIMPLALGGVNEDWNIQLLTQRCNNQKHAKDPIEFMQARGYLL